MNRFFSDLAALVCLLLCLAGCDRHSEDQGRHEPGHGTHASDELELTLNNGEKWRMDEHTRISAARITELVDGFEPLASVQQARALGERLDEELGTLVKGCTMTGPAHDQLHTFLVALFPKVESLKVETEVSDLRLARAEIASLLSKYESHFE